MTMACDNLGRHSRPQEPEGGQFQYGYRSDSLIDFLINPQSQRTTFLYDDAGRRTGQLLANGTRESLTYDPADRVTRVANLTSGGTTLSSFNYDLDAVGNRLACLEEGGIRTTWTYDDTYQLTNEQRNGANSYNVTHVYDEVGNRTVQLDGGIRTTFTYNAANQITKQEVAGAIATMTYDESGNAQTARVGNDPPITLTWDFENRLTEKAQTPVKTANDYDPDGLRVRRRQFLGAVVVATDKHVWDGMNILLETDASDVTQRIYTMEPELFGNLVSKRVGGATEYYHFDALGSTRQTTDAAQAIARSYAFKAFGEYVVGSWDANQPFTWVGRHGYYDDFDRFYIRARHYSPGIVVWLSEDEASDDELRNLYRYASNLPTERVDPSGLLSARRGTHDPKKCGGFFRQDPWILGKQDKGGFILQRVTIKYVHSPCNTACCCPENKGEPKKICYWEYFEARGKDTIPDTVQAPSQGERQCVGCGFFRFTFIATFVRRDAFVRARKGCSFKAQPVEFARGLPSLLCDSKCEEALFRLLQYGESKVTKTVDGKWDCCENVENTKIDASGP